ncbi:hypothetical protein Dip510_000994 [Elusimicrobium posterum]|uniref:Flp family type IVb pilin n=1 Tax=Elusimicrobium posterum TaxID=3116653 RepID=UPI003C72FC5D
MKKQVFALLKSKRAQTAVEYVLTTAMMFMVLVSFYVLYSRLLPQQFELGAKVILTVYDPRE